MFRLRLLLWSTSFMLLIAGAMPSPHAHAAQGGLAGDYTVFLPLVVKSGAPVRTPPPVQASFARWLPDINTFGNPVGTYRASVAVDMAGGLHAIYTRYGSGADLLTPAVYAYCSQNCASAASWTRIHLGEAFADAEIQLDPQGHPRAMLYGSARDPNNDLRVLYTYALCDAGCTDPAAWTLTPLVAPLEPQALRSEHNNHYFALDTHGRPSFIYTDTANNNHPGTWYAYCAGPIAGCGEAAPWMETQLSQGLLGNPSLVFTPQGQPRVMADFYNPDRSTNEVWYGACDAGCDSPNGWGWNHVWDMHGSGRAQLRVGPQGQPRAMFYSGNYASAPFAAGQLYYAWCDADCTNAEWNFGDLGLPTLAGAEADLAIDRQGNPRVAYADADQGLSYAWCNIACASAAGQWRTKTIEPSAALANDFEVLPVHRCTVSTWFNGNRPWLALDAAGNPAVGYDAQHWWYGVELAGGTGRQCNDQDITVTRVARFAQPAQ